MVGFSGLLYDYPDHLALANDISPCNQKLAPTATVRDVSITVLFAHWCVVIYLAASKQWLSLVAATTAVVVNVL